mmetsp:Transcript_54315/g.156165  ORF Transcript_54315/g.156165 Transcript_54315/m.156165 type:complete len:190 (+) Transcript_54315:182-751(+)
MTGFVPSGDMLEEGDDDQDGCIGPPPRASVCGGGAQSSMLQLGSGWAPMKLWSSDEDAESGAGFLCAQDVTRQVFWAKLETRDGNDDIDGEAIKGAITTLLDVAESFNSRKITLGLSAEHTACAELVCSLLYLGFQVVPSRKSPLPNMVLLFDFDLGLPSGYDSDNRVTASEASTASAPSLDESDLDTD